MELTEVTEFPSKMAVEDVLETLKLIQYHAIQEVSTVTQEAYTLNYGLFFGLDLVINALSDFDSIPGLKPKEEQTTAAAEDLERAYYRADVDGAESLILWAAYQYTKSNPEWFRNWNQYIHLDEALFDASRGPSEEKDWVACHTLLSAAYVALNNIDLRFDADRHEMTDLTEGETR